MNALDDTPDSPDPIDICDDAKTQMNEVKDRLYSLMLEAKELGVIGVLILGTADPINETCRWDYACTGNSFESRALVQMMQDNLRFGGDC